MEGFHVIHEMHRTGYSGRSCPETLPKGQSKENSVKPILDYAIDLHDIYYVLALKAGNSPIRHYKIQIRRFPHNHT